MRPDTPPRDTDTKRGNPDRNDVRHLRIEATPDGVHPARPACNNGFFHVRWTSNHDRVTCPKCRTLISAFVLAAKALSDFDPDRPNVAPDDGTWWEERDALITAFDEAKSKITAP